MEKGNLRYAVDGDPSLLVLEIPDSIGPEGTGCYTFALPLMQRRGGLLLVVPMGAIDRDKLVDEMTSEGEDLLGPSRSFIAELAVEEDGGATVLIGVKARFMVVDFSDQVLAIAKEYVPEEDEMKDIVVFNDEHPGALPTLVDVPDQVIEWARGAHAGRAHFYSARDEPAPSPAPKTPPPKKATQKRVTNATMMDQLAALQSQVQALVSAQLVGGQPSTEVAEEPIDPGAGKQLGVPKMPALSSALVGPPTLMVPSVKKAAALVGPPPKSMAASPGPGRNRAVMPEDEPKDWKEGHATSGDPLLHAISQQGSALTALVAHLAASGSDPMTDLSGSASSSLSSSTKGVQRRERLQNELASGTSSFYLQLLQQLHRRMYPSRAIPKTEEDFHGTDLSLLQYLERFGGYKNQRETGLTLWLLGYVLDALIQGDIAKAQEHLALTIAALEQTGVDGDWTLGWLLALVEEPPIQLFQEKSINLQSQGRPFAPLVAPTHAAVAIAYLKEIEILNSRKKETQKPSPTRTTENTESTTSPRRRPRYPKKPKASPSSSQ